MEGCPVRLVNAAARMTFHPCLAVRLGILNGQGQHLQNANKTYNLWLDVGPTVRVRIAVSAWLLLEIQGSLMLPINRPSFDVQDGLSTQPNQVFSVPNLGGMVGIGAAYRFP